MFLIGFWAVQVLAYLKMPPPTGVCLRLLDILRSGFGISRPGALPATFTHLDEGGGRTWDGTRLRGDVNTPAFRKFAASPGTLGVQTNSWMPWSIVILRHFSLFASRTIPCI
jgi:hypothetical protein